ncbi:hypothetical protein A5648_15395 [Mycolicibacter sinensis]|uniref:SnoaL-like domain-containing protein n=2 Tax=Mycolicibacter sinensis (strain JDM601) TaxID=875328 RepID=A0A1A3U842_MYCSD|nr:hypothetical protein A5648_15395 [Mycolicibacter sinensis]
MLIEDRGRYSDEHQSSIDLWEDFFVKVRAQEDMYVKAGMPADGLTDFLIKWFYAWEKRSITGLRACFNDHMVYADPTTACRDWTASQLECDVYSLGFRICPDMVFYPQDDTIRALPYYDFLDDEVRVTFPWRAIGRYRYTPRSFDVLGVDRYNLVRDPERGWLITRIDTDFDLFGALGQVMPIPIRAPKQRTVKLVLGTLQKIFPGLHGPVVRPFIHDQH